jgi:Arc/MetJ family transcription regulator
MKPNLKLIDCTPEPTGADKFIADTMREIAVDEAKSRANSQAGRHAVEELKDMILEAEMGAPQRAIRAADSELVIGTMSDLLRKIGRKHPEYAPEIGAALVLASLI